MKTFAVGLAALLFSTSVFAQNAGGGMAGNTGGSGRRRHGPAWRENAPAARVPVDREMGGGQGAQHEAAGQRTGGDRGMQARGSDRQGAEHQGAEHREADRQSAERRSGDRRPAPTELSVAGTTRHAPSAATARPAPARAAAPTSGPSVSRASIAARAASCSSAGAGWFTARRNTGASSPSSIAPVRAATWSSAASA